MNAQLIIPLLISLIFPMAGSAKSADGSIFNDPAFQELQRRAKEGDEEAVVKLMAKAPDVLGDRSTSDHGNYVVLLMVLLTEIGDEKFAQALAKQTRSCNLVFAKYFLPYLLFEEESKKKYPKTIHELLM
jgi:hypothetical protein